MKKKLTQNKILDLLGIENISQDLFGIDSDKQRSRKVVPWQWLLWSVLLAFILGAIISFQSETILWIVIFAIVLAIIVYMAHSSETVEPQIFLLTHDKKVGSSTAPIPVTTPTVVESAPKEKTTTKKKVATKKATKATTTKKATKATTKPAKKVSTTKKATTTKKTVKKPVAKKTKTRK